MPYERSITLTTAAAVAAGTPVAVSSSFPNGTSVIGHFVLTGTLTTNVQVSHDNVTWTSIGSAVSASSLVVFNVTGVKWIRLNTTAWTSGFPTARFHGLAPLRIYT